MNDNQSIRLSAITSSDKRMDVIDTHILLDTPVNKYEVSCSVCGFPDIDKIPEPYYIAKGRNFSGIEIVEADLGNLFISERLKKIFEILIPNQCVYEKTFIEQTNISTKWWLTIPRKSFVSGEVKENVQRCKNCHQPLYAHPGSQYKFWIHEFEAPYDIAKSKNWYSTDDYDWKKSWIGRDVFISLRLIFLLKKIAAKGIYKIATNNNTKYKSLIEAEKIWIEESIIKIGSLKDNISSEKTKEDIEKFRKFYSITDNSDLNIKEFEERFKIAANEITKNICSIKVETSIDIGFEHQFKIEFIKNWKITKIKIKLVAFAFDGYGSYILFDPKDRNCPLYFYDHELMMYDLVQSSILNLINV